jgi:hypothetical protein
MKLTFILLLLSFAAFGQVSIERGSLQQGYSFQQITAIITDSTKVTQVYSSMGNHYAVVFQAAEGDTAKYDMVTYFFKKYRIMPPVAIQATAYVTQQGITTATDYIGSTDNGDFVSYNIQLSGYKKIYAEYGRQWTGQGIAEIHEATAAGRLLGTLILPNTGTWTSYSTVSTTILPSNSGTVFIVFKAEGCGNFKKFRFE